MTYSIFGGALAMTGTVLSEKHLRPYQYFFSDQFGEEKRRHFLNYIHIENNGKGCYLNTWEFLINHPVAVHRLLTVTDIASKALVTLGCALTVTAAAATFGVPTAGIIGLNCVVITPLVTKFLRFQWKELHSLDKILTPVVILAGMVAQCSLFTAAGEFGIRVWLVLAQWALAMRFVCKQGNPEKDWEDTIFYKKMNAEFIANEAHYDPRQALEKLEVLQARVNEHGMCEESQKITTKYLRFFIAKTVEEFHTKFKSLHDKIEQCPEDNLQELTQILDEFKALSNLEEQLEPLHSRMLQLLSLKTKKTITFKEVQNRFKAEWQQLDQDLKQLKTIYEERISKVFYPQISEKMKQAGSDEQKGNFQELNDLCARLQNPLELNHTGVKLVQPSLDLTKSAGKFYKEPSENEAKASYLKHEDMATTSFFIFLYACIFCVISESV